VVPSLFDPQGYSVGIQLDVGVAVFPLLEPLQPAKQLSLWILKPQRYAWADAGTSPARSVIARIVRVINALGSTGGQWTKVPFFL